MNSFKHQKDLIEDRKWDCLIILDACRYDFFEKVYKDHIKGTLQKVISPGSATCEWLRQIFDKNEYDDVVYVSGSPYVNSKGSSIVKGFSKIIDVWDWGWSDDLKTVPPGKVGKATRMARARYPNKRLISHFIQPHPPYLSIGPLVGGFSVAEGKRKQEKGKKSLTRKIRAFVGNKTANLLGKMRVRRLGSILNIGKPGSTESVARKYGKRKLREIYEKNLRSGLQEVARTAKRLPGKKIVTADHGELLGEGGVYGHISGVDNPILREVPWLEVES